MGRTATQSGDRRRHGRWGRCAGWRGAGGGGVRRPQRPRGPQWVSHASVRRAAGGGTLDTCIQPLITDPWTVGGTSGCEVATGCEQLVETIFRQVFCLTFGGSGRYQSNAKQGLKTGLQTENDCTQSSRPRDGCQPFSKQPLNVPMHCQPNAMREPSSSDQLHFFHGLEQLHERPVLWKLPVGTAKATCHETQWQPRHSSSSCSATGFSHQWPRSLHWKNINQQTMRLRPIKQNMPYTSVPGTIP